MNQKLSPLKLGSLLAAILWAIRLQAFHREVFDWAYCYQCLRLSPSERSVRTVFAIMLLTLRLARSSVLNQRSKLGKTTADRSASSTRTAIISINVNPLRIELRVLFCHDIGIQSLAVWFSICSEWDDGKSLSVRAGRNYFVGVIPGVNWNLTFK